MKKLALFLILVPSIFLNQYLCPVRAETKRSAGKSPTVKIISPREGEIVNGKITIEAKVSDPSRVKFLDFYIQEPGAKDRYGWQDYSAPYYWGGDEQMLDTTLFDDGPASATVGCYPEDSRLPMTKDRVHFTIDNGKPRVKIISPKDVPGLEKRTQVHVDAHDLKGIRQTAGIRAVYIYLDGHLLRTLRTEPFQTRIETYLLSPGLHSIKVVAEDSEGLTSAAVTSVIVNSEASSVLLEKK